MENERMVNGNSENGQRVTWSAFFDGRRKRARQFPVKFERTASPMNFVARLSEFLFWTYLLGLVIVIVALYFAGDRVWWGTLLLFGPRWVWGIPLPIIIVSAWRRPGKRRWCSIAAIGVFCYFLLGFNLPFAVFKRFDQQKLRLMTLNMQGDNTDWRSLQLLMKKFDPDVVLLQECSPKVREQLPENWNTTQDGELAIATRFPLKSLAVVNRRLEHRYPRAIGIVNAISLPTGSATIATIHLHSPSNGLRTILSRATFLDLRHRALIDQEIQWRREEAEHVGASLQDIDDSLIIAGDFNMPVESTIYQNTWGKFRNAFSWSGFGFGATAFEQQAGLWNSARIDHVLHRGNWRCTSCWVGSNVGSDHRPLFADLVYAQ